MRKRRKKTTKRKKKDANPRRGANRRKEENLVIEENLERGKGLEVGTNRKHLQSSAARIGDLKVETSQRRRRAQMEYKLSILQQPTTMMINRLEKQTQRRGLND